MIQGGLLGLDMLRERERAEVLPNYFRMEKRSGFNGHSRVVLKTL
jgi:hypothetical protein